MMIMIGMMIKIIMIIILWACMPPDFHACSIDDNDDDMLALEQQPARVTLSHTCSLFCQVTQARFYHDEDDDDDKDDEDSS